jgi:hypothetical protein
MSDADLESADAAILSLCCCISSAGGAIYPCVSVQTNRSMRNSSDQTSSNETPSVSRRLVAMTDIRAGVLRAPVRSAHIPQPRRAGTPLLRVPVSLIITPSLANRIILAHNPLNSSTQTSPCGHKHQASLSHLSPLSPLALICAAIAIIRCCSRDHHHCLICSPHTHYISVLGQAPAASLLVIDNATFDLHVQPLLIRTPLAESLPRARLELRLQAEEISKLIGLSADDVVWAFRYMPAHR